MNTARSYFQNSSFPGQVAKASGLVLLFVSFCSIAQVSEQDLRLPISLDAESTNYDGKSSMLMFTGLRLTQGNISVEADDGRATKLDFEDSLWRFSGNVIIDTESGHIECDKADLSFKNHQLVSATITGSPATFEIRRPEKEETTYAEAGRLDYDFKRAVVEFSENATITEGGNQIASNYLVYNIKERRINAQSAGKDGDRVKIIYTPSPVEVPAATDGSSDTDLDQPNTDVASEARDAALTPAATDNPPDMNDDQATAPVETTPALDDEKATTPDPGADSP